MNGNQSAKAPLELTKKGKIILGALIAVIIAAVAILVVVNKNNSDKTTKGLKDASLAITVTPDKGSGSTMILSPGNETTSGISVGGTATLTYAFDKDIKEDVRWIVSDTSIASVDNGVLTGLKAGTVEIYAVAVDDDSVKSNTVTLQVNR